MSTIDLVLAWVGIGIGASIATWMWPFRRGFLGIFIVAAAAISGALLGGAVSLALGVMERGLYGATFLAAALGAFLAIGGVHLAWSRHVHARTRH